MPSLFALSSGKRTMSLPRRRLLVAVMAVAVGVVIWTSTLSPKRPHIAFQSIKIQHWNVSLGQDSRGVPTGLLTSKSKVVLRLTNADNFWRYSIKGLMKMNIFLRQISSTTIDRLYESGKTSKTVVIELKSRYVPLYGASPSVAYSDGQKFYIFFEAALQTEAGLLPLMYKYSFTDIVTCRLTGVSAGPNHSLAILSSHSCPHVVE